MSQQLSCEFADMASLAPEWRQLAFQTANVFATFEWAETWWRHYGAKKTAWIVACRAPDGSLVAIFPLYLARKGPLRVLRFIGDGPSDELGPICVPASRPAVAAAFKRFLSEHRLGWDLLVGRALPRQAGWSERLSARVIHREASPAVMLAGRSWEEFLSSRSSHFRERVSSRERRLQRQHGLQYRLIQDAAELPRSLDTFFTLHRILRASNDTISSFDAAANFHRDFIGRAFEAGWLRLWLADLDGQPAAAVLDYSYAGVVSGYQMGLDSTWRRLAHIRILIANSLRAAFRENAREYRLLRGGEDYKYQFADTDPGLETILLGNGVVGRLAAKMIFCLRRARPLYRRMQRSTRQFLRGKPGP